MQYKIKNLKIKNKTNKIIISDNSISSDKSYDEICTNKKTYEITNHSSNYKLKKILKKNNIVSDNKNHHELKQAVNQLSNKKFERICDKIIHQNNK